MVPDNPDECWEWQGNRGPKGYGGEIRHQGKRHRAHVWALIFHLGRELAPGMQANHTCDNPACVNVSPGHLYEGTQAENMKDRERKTECSYGHAWAEHGRILPDGHRRCRACERRRDRM